MQTLDMIFLAPRFDAVWKEDRRIAPHAQGCHNGQLIHDKVEMKTPTATTGQARAAHRAVLRSPITDRYRFACQGPTLWREQGPVT